MRLPNRLFRLAFRTIYPLARIWWRMVGHEGVAVAVWANQRVLVVRHSYKPNWRLPGGGIKRGETSRLTAVRELREETGLVVSPDALREVFKIGGRYGWVHILETHLADEPSLTVDRREIIAAGFQPPTEAAEPNLLVKEYLRAARTATP
jgi:8-oxo-dGTP diphosphatase